MNSCEKIYTGNFAKRSVMKDYLLIFRGGLDFSTATLDQLQKAVGNWKSWIEELTKKGIYRGGERVIRTDAAVVDGASRKIISGPYFANNETVGGFIGIKAENLAQAIEITKDCPIFNFDGKVEVREVAVM
jgi:hypothetical protein